MSEFKKTKIQNKAVRLISGKSKHNMLYGGSRSGKTFILVYAICVRAMKCESRHVMLRHTFNSIKTSVWMDTLPKVMSICFPYINLTPKNWDKSNYVLKLPNAEGTLSEIWIAGLDDDKRVEKILGKEFSTLYFNECSQLSYTSIQVALTRLAQKNSLAKKVYYDANPPSKKHWSYWLFEKKVNPVESEPLKDPDNYAKMLMNPADNIENIDEDYLNMLDALPEKERKRFLLGQYVDGDDGLAYYAFNNEKHVKEFTLPNHGTIFIGMDFNVHPMTAVVFKVFDNCIFVYDEAFLENSDTFKMCDYLLKKKYVGKVIPDSTGKNRKTSGKSDHRILKENGFEVMGTRNPFVTDRVNNLNRLFTEGRIVIHPRCKKLINDLNKVSWKDNKLDQKTDPMLTHISDCIGYGAWKLMPISDQNKGMDIIIR